MLARTSDLSVAVIVVVGVATGVLIVGDFVTATLLTIGLALTVVFLLDTRRSYLSPSLPLLLAFYTSALFPALLGHYNGTPRMGITPSHYRLAAVALLLFVLPLCAVYLVLTAKKRSDDRSWRSLSIRQGEERNRSFTRARRLCVAALVFAVAVFLLATRTTGGVSTYWDALANRRVAFQGQGWLAWALIAPSTASLVALAHFKPASTRTGGPRVGVVASLIIMLFGAAALLLLTGNRMNVVTFAAAGAVVVHKRIRPIAMSTAAAGVFVALVVGLALPTLLRPASSSSQLQARSLADSYEDIDKTGPIADFGQVAGLAMVLGDGFDIPRQMGRSYLAAATMGLPRHIAPWKLPDIGEVATKAVLPRYWATGTGMQITGAGEAYLNFGWLGVPVVGGLAGYGMSLLARLRQRTDARSAVFYAILLPRVALYFRGGFANVTAYLLMELAVAIVCFAIIKRRRHGRLAQSRGTGLVRAQVTP